MIENLIFSFRILNLLLDFGKFSIIVTKIGQKFAKNWPKVCKNCKIYGILNSDNRLAYLVVVRWEIHFHRTVSIHVPTAKRNKNRQYYEISASAKINLLQFQADRGCSFPSIRMRTTRILKGGSVKDNQNEMLEVLNQYLDTEIDEFTKSCPEQNHV